MTNGPTGIDSEHLYGYIYGTKFSKEDFIADQCNYCSKNNISVHFRHNFLLFICSAIVNEINIEKAIASKY